MTARAPQQQIRGDKLHLSLLEKNTLKEKKNMAILKTIMSPLLVEYDEKYKATMDNVAAMSASAEDTVTLEY